MATPLETVQQMYQAFGAGDMDTFFSHVTDDATWESRYPAEIPFAGTFKGKEAIAHFFGMVQTELELHAFSPEKMLGDDDTVVSLGYEDVTVKSTGRKYRNNWVHVFSFKNGKVYNFQTSNDAEATQAAFRSE